MINFKASHWSKNILHISSVTCRIGVCHSHLGFVNMGLLPINDKSQWQILKSHYSWRIFHSTWVYRGPYLYFIPIYDKHPHIFIGGVRHIWVGLVICGGICQILVGFVKYGLLYTEVLTNYFSMVFLELVSFINMAKMFPHIWQIQMTNLYKIF